MVAYSFKERFIKPIEVGLSRVALSFDCAPKRQTVRGHGKRRHARPGEELQLYYAMRTKQCRMIGRARCTNTREIIIVPRTMKIIVDGVELDTEARYAFVRADGFEGVADMQDFWQSEHPGVTTFAGVVIEWELL